MSEATRAALRHLKKIKDNEPKHSDFYGGLGIGAASAIACLCLVSALTRENLAVATHTLLSDYGSVVAGTLATFAAFITVRSINKNADDDLIVRRKSAREAISRNIQLGSLELLSTLFILQTRYQFHLAIDPNSTKGEHAFQQEHLPTPEKISQNILIAMSYLRGSEGFRTMVHVDQLAHFAKIPSRTTLESDRRLTAKALVMAIEGYLILRIQNLHYDIEADHLGAGEFRADGDDFRLIAKEFLQETQLKIDLIETAAAEINKPLWWLSD
ncbi:MAG: hypothetical protein WA138_03000 [Parvibaculum sp.]